MNAGPHFFRLDAIRGVAIVWVMALHICGACWGWDLEHWGDGLALPLQGLVRLFGQGGLGVPMFFVLSGFLIHYTFGRSPDQSVRTFLYRRFGRIYPPYAVALLMFAAWQGVFWTRHGRNDLLNHALFIHTFKNSQFFSINSSFWSLAHEFQFYLLYPLLFQVRRRIGMTTLVWGSLAARLAIDILTMPDRFEGNLVVRMMLPKLYFEWILGMYVADCFLQNRRAFSWPAAAGWVFAAIAYCTAATPWLSLATAPAISLATAIWIDRIVHLRGEPLAFERLLAPLGVVSYSLYLWHQPIVNMLCPRIVQSTRGLEVCSLAGLTIVAALVSSVVCLLVAKGAYELIEAPCMKAVRRLTSPSGKPQGRALPDEPAIALHRAA